MYKIMLVDDFIADLETLNHILGSFKDVDVVALCQNGMEALELIPSCRPDIIISDIEMPVINGFELAKNVRRDYPGIKIVFCSFHDEFEYARKALYLDGYGYVLKPIDPDELKQCILGVIEEISCQFSNNREYIELKELMEKNKPILIENFIKELVYGLNKNAFDIQDKCEYFGLNIKKGVYYLLLIEIDDYQKITLNLPFEKRQMLTSKLFNKLNELHGSYSNAILSKLDSSHFIILYCLDEVFSDKAALDYVSSGCSNIISEFKKTDVGLSFAVSNCCTNIINLSDLYEQCIYALRYKFIFGKGKIIFFNEIPYSFTLPHVDFNKMQKEIRFMLNTGTVEEGRKYIGELFENFTAGTDPQYTKDVCFQIVICIQTILHEHRESFQSIFGDEKLIWQKIFDFETIADIKDWIENIVLSSVEHIENKKAQKNNSVAEEVKKYIEANFSRDINIDAIAGDIHYNPDYLNQIFKASTGETIYDYLCRYKIEKAKALLSNTAMRLYEIADFLGFSHTAYFSSFFKKYTGLTPKDYRGNGDA